MNTLTFILEAYNYSNDYLMHRKRMAEVHYGEECILMQLIQMTNWLYIGSIYVDAADR